MRCQAAAFCSFGPRLRCFFSPPSRPGGLGPLAPLRPIRPRARRAGWGLGLRGSAGAGPGGLWGDVLSTHCEEAGGRDPPLRRLAERMMAGQGRRGVRARPVEHFYPTSIGPSVPGRYLDPSTTPSSSTVKGTLARYSQTLCRWADGAATVSGSDSWQRWGGRRLSNNKDSVLPTHCALRMDPSLIHPAPPEACQGSQGRRRCRR